MHCPRHKCGQLYPDLAQLCTNVAKFGTNVHNCGQIWHKCAQLCPGLAPMCTIVFKIWYKCVPICGKCGQCMDLGSNVGTQCSGVWTEGPHTLIGKGGKAPPFISISCPSESWHALSKAQMCTIAPNLAQLCTNVAKFGTNAYNCH